MQKHFAMLIAILLLVTLACSSIPFLSTPSSPATGQPSEVLFQDNFSDPSSGWDRVSQADGEANYADGYYRIFVNATRTDIWANPGLNFTDVRVEVDATKAGGSDNNDFGLTCRTVDAKDFYFFYISSDGYYGIGKLKGEKQELIGMDALKPSEKIKQGAATNHIRADCAGNKLVLYVNGEKIGEAEDTEFASGDVGIIAGSYDTPGTDVHFDNFTVLKP